MGNTLLGWSVAGPAGGVVAAIVNSMQESDTEAGQTFVESLKRWKSSDDAYKAAQEVRLKNMLYLPASNYGADYMFYKGAELIGQYTDNWLPGTGLLSRGARWLVRNALPFVANNVNEGIEEWNQELFQSIALGDEFDPDRLSDAFTMGMVDAAIYSIIGGLLRKGINAGGAKIYSLTPQGKARADNQKLFNQFLTGVRDLYNLQQNIQQGKISLDDTVQQIPVVFLPRSKLDDNTARALGIQQEILEDDNGYNVQDFNGIDNTDAAAWQDIEGLGLQDEQDEQDSHSEENLDEEVPVRKELWDKFKTDFPQQAADLADFVRDGTQGITAREQLQELQQNISQIASENEAVAQEIPKLTQRLVDAGVNQQEAANIANIAGAVANSLNKRYGIDVAQSMNIVTSPESAAQRESYNQDDRRSGARKFLDIINESFREIVEKEKVAPSDAILDTKQVMQKARELGISEQNIDAFIEKLSELGFLKMYIQRNRDHSTGEVREEKAGYRIKAYDALRFYNSSRQQIIDTLRDEVLELGRSNSFDYQEHIAIPLLDTSLGLLDFDARFWMPDDPQFAEMVKHINNLDFKEWADIEKVLDKLSKKQISTLARQMGFFLSDVNAPSNTREHMISEFKKEIMIRAHNRYYGSIDYTIGQGLDNPSNHLLEVLDKLKKQIDFLHSLENDYKDNLYYTPPPPPPPVDHTAGRIGSFKIGKNEYSVFPYQLSNDNPFKRIFGPMLEIRDSSNGELIGRYSPAFDVLEIPNRSIAFEEKLNKSFRKNLQTFLKAAGLLDENGQLISDGNEQLRQHFRDWMSEDKTRRGQDFPFQQYEEQQDNQHQQDNQTQQDNTAQTLNGELDVGELVFPYQSKTYKFKVVATDSTIYDNEGTGDSIRATRLQRYKGRRLEVRTSRGKVVHTYYPYQDGAEWWGDALDNKKKYTKRWIDTYDRHFKAHLQEYLRQGGFLDEQGNLKPDGNEKMRRRWDALEDSDKTKHDHMFYSDVVFPEDALDDTKPLPQPQTVSQNQPASQATEKIATAQDFKAAYDELHKFREFPRIPDLRRKLNWPREVFDQMIRTLRDDMTIQIEQADESLFTHDEILDCFVDENNYKMGLLIWNDRGTPSVSIPYQELDQAATSGTNQITPHDNTTIDNPTARVLASFGNKSFSPQEFIKAAKAQGISNQQANSDINSLIQAGVVKMSYDPSTEDMAFQVIRQDLLHGGQLQQAATSPQQQTRSTTQDTHGTATAQDFKAAYDELHKFREFPRIPDLRRKLNWPREVFDQMIRTLRDDMTIQLYRADESTMTKDEVQDCFFARNNLIMGTLSWMNDSTPSVSIPFSSTQNTSSQDNNLDNSEQSIQDKPSEILDTEDNYIPERTDEPHSDGVIDFNSLIIVNQRSENEFRDAINTLHDILGGELVMPENMKSSELIKQEAAQYEEDYSRVVDVWSATINFDNQQDFSNAFDTLDSLPDVIRLLQSDNQAVANIRLEEGAVVELRINLSEQQHSSNDTLSETSTTQDIFNTEKGLPVSLADSKDFLLTPDGNSILSVIDEQTANAAGIKPGGIRANVGALRHAEARHGKQITEAGYDSVQALLLDVLNNWSQIWEGTKGSYLLARPLQNKHHGTAAIQLVLDNDGGYHVTTLMYRNDKALKNKKLLTAGRSFHADSSGSAMNLTPEISSPAGSPSVKSDFSSEQLNSDSLAGQTESVNQQQDTQDLSNDELEYLQSHNWDVDDLKARYSVPQIKETIAQKIRQQRISDTGELATLPKPIFSIPLGQKFADNIDVEINTNFKEHPVSEHLVLQALECSLFDLVYKNTSESIDDQESHWAGAARILAYGRGILFADKNGTIVTAYFPYINKFRNTNVLASVSASGNLKVWSDSELGNLSREAREKLYRSQGVRGKLMPGLNRFATSKEMIGPDSDKVINIQDSDIEKALQPILPDILRAGGFTDEQGYLKDDGNEA